MKRMVSALSLIIISVLIAGRPHAETATPSDAREPVRVTLDECIDLGLERNPELGVSRAQVDQASSQVLQAKSKQYPTLTFSANVVTTNTLGNFAMGDPTLFASGPPDPTGSVTNHTHLLGFPSFEITSDRQGEIYNAKVEAQYALYTGGKIENGVKAAKLNEDAAKERLHQKRNELIYGITQAFYGVLLAQEMVKVVDDAYNTAMSHYDQVKALYQEGLVSDLDVVRTEAKIAEIRPLQIEARNGLWMARLGLNNYLNIDLDTPVEAIGSLEYDKHVLALPEDLYAEALANRPEIKVIKLQGEMADKLLAIARTGAYPTVALFANYAWDKGQDMPPNDQVWQDGYQAGVAVSVPLFDGLQTPAKVAEVEAQTRQIHEGRRALELGIRTQVQQSVIALRAAEERISAQDANVKAAEKNHEVVKARYSVGLASNLDVIDAQSQLLRAQTDRLRAVHDYKMAWAQLQAALGDPEGGKQ